MKTKLLPFLTLLACASCGEERLPVLVTVQETNVNFMCPDPEQVPMYQEATRECGGSIYVYVCSPEPLCDAQIAAIMEPIVSCDETREQFEIEPASSDVCAA